MDESRLIFISRDCLKNNWGAVVRDFDWERGEVAGESPRRALIPQAGTTKLPVKRPTIRRIFEEKAVSLRCSSVAAPFGDAPSSRLASQPFPQKPHPHLFF